MKAYQDYLEFTRTTAIYPKDIECDYLILGLISELVELVGNPLVNELKFKELGDCCWYLFRLVDHFGSNLTFLSCSEDEVELQEAVDTYEQEEIDNFVVLFIGNLADTRKKYLRDKYPHEEFIQKMESLLARILFLLKTISRALFNRELEDALAENIKKLSSRKERNALSGSGDER